MTRREALKALVQMEHDGWADVQVMRDERGRATYVVSGVDPMTGVRGRWIADFADI